MRKYIPYDFYSIRGCLFAQVRVTSNGCLDDVNLLYFFLFCNYTFIYTYDERVVSVNNRKTASRFDFLVF